MTAAITERTPEGANQGPDLSGAALAAYQLLSSGTRLTLPVDPVPILRRLPGVRVVSWEYLARRLREAGGPTAEDILFHNDPWTAITVRPPQLRDRTFVVAKPHLTPDVHSFSMAHELGHLILKHEEESPCADAEANVFASHLLVPRPLLRHYRLHAPTLNRTQLARLFGVSPGLMAQAMEDRFTLPPDAESYLVSLFIGSSNIQ